MTGYEDGTFGPGDDVTREQLATMIERHASGVEGIDTGSDGSALFAMADAASVSPFARDAMAWVVDEGILTGDLSADQPRALPQGSAQRDQMAKMVSVLHSEVLGRGEVVPNPAPTIGRYGAFLAKVRELEGTYGTGRVVTGSRNISPVATWLNGLGFVKVVDFGDGIDRLVTARSAGDISGAYPDSWESYVVEVWDYRADADAVALAWSGEASYSGGRYAWVEFSTSPDGANTYLVRSLPPGANDVFVGALDGGACGVAHTTVYTPGPNVTYSVDGAQVSASAYFDVLRSLGVEGPNKNVVQHSLIGDADDGLERPAQTLQEAQRTIAWLESMA